MATLNIPRYEDAPAPTHSSGGASARELELSRRLDWRFLLPDPRLRNVALVGPAHGMLRMALESLSERFCSFPAALPHPTPRDFDLVVLTEVTGAGIADAAALLRPGGWFYGEIVRHWKSPLTHTLGPRRAVALLHQHGFSDVAPHWHLPDFDACSHIIPASQASSALAWVIQRSEGGFSHALHRELMRAALYLRLLRHCVPCVSLVATWRRR